MNRVYNTVWCPSRGMWVVTSELVRKGGQRPRQIKKSVLAGLIAGLLMPLHPVLATSYDSEILENRNLTLNFGDYASNTTINNGGELIVNTYGKSQLTRINSGGKESIFDGGNSTYSEVHDGGEQYISGSHSNVVSGVIYSGGKQVIQSGGETYHNHVTGGRQDVSGGLADYSIIDNGGTQHVLSGGSANYTTINSGGQQIISSGGSAAGTHINDAGVQNVLTGGRADFTVINTGGQQNISVGARVDATTINDAGVQNVLSGGSAIYTTINSGGQQIISSHGSANLSTLNDGGVQTVLRDGNAENTTINSGGTLKVDAGATGFMITQNDGGAVVTNTSAMLVGTNRYGHFSIMGGKASNMLLENGGILDVLDQGSANSTTVNSGGTLRVDAGGTATAITQNDDAAVVTNTSAVLEGNNRNGSFSITGGKASNMLLEHGGRLDVLSGHTASNTTLNSNGEMHVSAGGSALDTAVNAGGTQNVLSGGSATDTAVNSGGTQNISGGSAVSTTISDGGTQNVLSGGSATDTAVNSGGTQNISGGSAVSTTISDGGTQNVLSGGSATDTAVNAGGTQNISGGSAVSTTISDGGTQNVLSGGSATDTAVNAGGTQNISGGSAVSTAISDGGTQNVLSGGSATDTAVNAGGTQNISGGSAVSTTISDGGTQNVLSGGSATDTAVNAGGMQNVLREGEASATTVSSGGTLKVDAGGTATAITQNDGAAVVTNTSAVLEGNNRNGSFGISGGSAGNMLLENGGILEVYGRHEATDTWVGSGGTLLLNSGSVLKGTTTVTQDGMLSGPEVNNQGHLYYLNNSAAEYSGDITGTGDLTVDGGSLTLTGSLSQDSGVFISSGGVLNMDTLQATADVTAPTGTILNLKNGSTLTGRILDDGTGGGEVTMTDSSVWTLGGDSVVGTLNMDGSTVNFHAGTVPPQAATTLTAGGLSGNGTFLMNTDIAVYSGDLLNVTGNASGNFNLGIKNTGQEPVSAGAPLRVVHIGGGDAQFTLNGGKVDAGTWEYYLTRESTDWYLTPDIPPEIKPERQTTASTDAVLSMASAPAYIFNSELQNLRFRHGDIAQPSPAPGGVWGRYLGSDNRISGAAGSAYTLRQSGFETGADKIFDLGDSSIAAGTFFSYSDNSIKHARGGKSKVDSTGGGLYATWSNNDGYYVDGVLKYNRFNNELHTRMSDGTAVKGDYSQNGFGGSLEAGKTFSLNENVWAQPYARTTAFRADGRNVRLDNGMKARIDTTTSLQAEAGVSVGMNLDVGGTNVKPYLTAAVSHEFADNNKVRINDTYDFRNDISGTTGKYGLGVSAQLTPNAGVWAEANYQKGSNIESSVTGSVGFRLNF
ncbi:autotransporter outer membrane beta-barrel domain-containing protein [Atlantibacter hermannii]|uniref:autotransporter outer membrane beta-barrel domain-containing protein n=1 Tax=Atlantibacter hermannii TaxID=565 RepID=UPI00254201C7|nr:autotransporter outer membrane beta-barrel domain-containing protein [Atlantibacter hermannii]WIF57214.1 autotransporter outer membrane beta-barrel domain-containing protein [Atlantibacter hermannii]